MVPFGGWEMPVQYAGIVEEHRAVRRAVGLFDVSHMGEFEVEGPEALAVLQRLTTNDAAALAGRARCSTRCSATPRAASSTISRSTGSGPTASCSPSTRPTSTRTGRGSPRTAGGARWANVERATPRSSPCRGRAPRASSGASPTPTCAAHPRTTTSPRARWPACPRSSRAPATPARTASSSTSPRSAPSACGTRSSTRAGRDGIQPVGLGARDTLRLEMKFALYGNDIDETTNPLEAGLGWVVKPDKGDFIGRGAIEAMRARGVPRKLVGFEMVERAVPRHGYPLLRTGAEVGVVTSGSFAPPVERDIGMGYVRDGAGRGRHRARRRDPRAGPAGPRRPDALPSVPGEESLGEAARWQRPGGSQVHQGARVGEDRGRPGPHRASPTSPRSSSATWSSSSCPRWAPGSPR